MKRPQLNMLRTFKIAGCRLSFSRAAQELNISQAAVSQQIRNLERNLGSPLFLREHRSLTLTSAGAAYLSAVHEALDRLDTVTDQLFPDRPNQTVTIRCTSSIASLWLAPKVGAFHAAHPEITLRLQTLDSEQKTGQAAGVDLEIFVSAQDVSDTRTKRLLVSTITPVMSSELLDRSPLLNTPRDILGCELVHVLGYDDDWHRWVRRHGPKDATVPRGLMVDGSVIAIETALHGDGIMLGRRPFIDPYLRSGKLVEVFEGAFTLSATYFLRRFSTERSSERVVQWLRALAAETGP
ncbi:MAG: LysR family transcriptional regulator [Rhodobacteraceae bacterium]|nr:LysR family transcriptional regulator [Paracoccaceae bacterium]